LRKTCIADVEQAHFAAAAAPAEPGAAVLFVLFACKQWTTRRWDKVEDCITGASQRLAQVM
jgi:hypothetical protein